jgi:hypothetical protein
MSIDSFLGEKYDRRHNNCLHFAARAWAHLTGDMRLLEAREADLSSLKSAMRNYRRVEGATVEPSIALMLNLNGEEHIGVCVRRRLLHLAPDGAQFFPIEVAAAMYSKLRFYQ